MRISDWSSDVCSSDLQSRFRRVPASAIRSARPPNAKRIEIELPDIERLWRAGVLLCEGTMAVRDHRWLALFELPQPRRRCARLVALHIGALGRSVSAQYLHGRAVALPVGRQEGIRSGAPRGVDMGI